MPSDREEFLERIKKLPPDLTDAIFSEDIAETMLSIGKKYGLLIDKIGRLSEAVNDVILGVLHPKEFISTIEKTLSIDRETARKIAQEVNTEIFAKIRESLRKVHKIEDEPIPSIKLPMVEPPPNFTSDKKIPFSDLKPFDSAHGKPVVPAAAPLSGVAVARPFQDGGIKSSEIKKAEIVIDGKLDGNLEEEVEGILKTAEVAKPTEVPKNFTPHEPEVKAADSKSAVSGKPIVDVKIRRVEEMPDAPKASPFGSKMTDGVFRSAPAERKITETSPFDATQGKPASPTNHRALDPYREQPDEKERASD